MQHEGVSALRSESMSGEGIAEHHRIDPGRRNSLMIVKRAVIDDFEETFSLWESSPQWFCGICAENGEIIRKIGLAAFWRCNLLHVADEETNLWTLELAIFPQIPFVHPHAMERALKSFRCEEDDPDARKISALTSYYSGVQIDLRLVRDAYDMRPEPKELKFQTLDDTKAYIARKTPAIDTLFESVDVFLDKPLDSRA